MKPCCAIVVVAMTLACAQAPPRVPPAALPPSAAESTLQQTADAMKSARYALEPPSDAAQARDAATVQRMSEAQVTPEWIMLQIATMQSIADDAAVPDTQRARANVLAAAGEGLLIEHFTVFWDKAEAGRRVIAYLRAALAEDPQNVEAAVAYTFTLLGIRSSGFRSQAESTMGVNTTRELAQTAPLLDGHRDSLLAQSVLACALAALASDDPATVATLSPGLVPRVTALRAHDTGATMLVDDQLQRCSKYATNAPP